MHAIPRLITIVALASILPATLAAQDDAKPPEPNREPQFLSGIRQLTFEGLRSGEGYFSSDGRKLVYQSERLPENPLIIRPLEQIGAYGGTIRRALTGDIVQVPGPSKTMAENLMSYSKPVPDSLVIGLAESYTFSEGGKVAIFKLRRGLRWSDGHPGAG